MKRSRVNRSLVAMVLSMVLCFANVPMAGAAGIIGEISDAAGSSAIYRVGDTVTYNLATGPDNGSDLVLDIDFKNPNGSLVRLATGQAIATGEKWTNQHSYTIQAGDVKAGRVATRLLASNYNYAEDEIAEIEVECFVRVIKPGLSIKTLVDYDRDGDFSDASESYYVGEPATWKVLVENTGDCDISDISVTDSNGHPFAPFSLASGSVKEFTYDQTISAKMTNTARATGTAIDGKSVGPCEDSATADPFVASVALEKVVDFNRDGNFSESENGHRDTNAHWKLTVRNDGELDLVDVNVTDDNGQTFSVDSLPAGATQTFDYWTEVGNDLTNHATVTATDENQRAVTPDSDSASVHVLVPGLEISKSASPNVILAGESVEYSFTVKNTSEFSLDTVVVTDDHLGDIGVVGPLAPNESAVLKKSAHVNQDTVNTAVATGHYVAAPEDSRTVTDTAQESVNVIHPDVSIDKSSDAEGPVPVGTVVTYDYAVTNTGDVPLIDLEVTDDLLGAIGTIAYLAPLETASLTATSTILEDTVNVGTVTGSDEYEHSVSDQDTETVEVLVRFPDMAIEKSAASTSGIPGDLITYTLTYRNVGTGPTTAGYGVIDDFDERYVEVVDAAGGLVEDGTITWLFLDDMQPLDPDRTITYTVRVLDETVLPLGLTPVGNVVVIDAAGDLNEQNDMDDETVQIENAFLPFTPDDPDSKPRPTAAFLPFTGGSGSRLIVMAGVSLLVGLLLRRRLTDPS